MIGQRAPSGTAQFRSYRLDTRMFKTSPSGTSRLGVLTNKDAPDATELPETYRRWVISFALTSKVFADHAGISHVWHLATTASTRFRTVSRFLMQTDSCCCWVAHVDSTFPSPLPSPWSFPPVSAPDCYTCTFLDTLLQRCFARLGVSDSQHLNNKPTSVTRFRINSRSLLTANRDVLSCT